jgi:ParB-like nuclease domain
MATKKESIAHRSASQQTADPFRHNPGATNAGLVELQIQYRATADFKLDGRNPRQHSQRQVKQLADSIKEFGFVMPVVADDKGQVVIGHGRVLAAKMLGMLRIPVVEIRHLSEAQLKALRIADNKLAQNSHWDERLLGENLLELKGLDRDFDLSITGFSLPEIDLAIQSLSEPLVQDDDTSSATGVSSLIAFWEVAPHCSRPNAQAASVAGSSWTHCTWILRSAAGRT